MLRDDISHTRNLLFLRVVLKDIKNVFFYNGVVFSFYVENYLCSIYVNPLSLFLGVSKKKIYVSSFFTAFTWHFE